jgi:hypothetical protein
MTDSGCSFRGCGASAGSERIAATMSSVEPDLLGSESSSLPDRLLEAAQRLVLQTGARRLTDGVAGEARPCTATSHPRTS